VHEPDPEFAAAVESVVLTVGAELGEHLAELTTIVQERLTTEITDLRGDPLLQELLHASIESNIDALGRILRYGLAIPEATAPPAAAEYARRLAQRGTDPVALLRAYRLGQETTLSWALGRVDGHAADRSVAIEATHKFVEASFRYIDAVSTQVVADYERERVRWLANSNSVRSATLTDVLAGKVGETTATEAALGYRLRQHHVALVLWLDGVGSPDDLRALESLLTLIGKELGAGGAGLFIPQGRSAAWGWLPFGRTTARPDALSRAVLDEATRIGAHVALGSPSVGVEGFRSTHDEARAAQELAMSARGRTERATFWTDPDVRAATLLLRDVDTTRRLVHSALGALAADDEATARLRETTRTFFAEGSSFAAAAARLNVHKNTVRYRLEKAAEVRGRPLEVDRLDLELALIACEWLGPEVLRP
jgi:DNA-binding PucR family transcriptional regulator